MYAMNLTFVAIDNKSEEFRQNNLKAAEIAERILSECTDTQIRNRMQGELCNYYQNLDMTAKALEIANTLPSMWESSEIVKMNILKGSDLVLLIQNNIYSITFLMTLCLQNLSDMRAENNPSLTWEQRIEILRKAIEIFDIVYDKGDYNICTHSISCLYRDISAIAVRAGEFELALESLEKAAEYAKAADELPEKKPYVSLLVNRLEYNAANVSKNSGGTFSEWFLRKMSESIYDEIRDDPRFKTVESTLQNLA